MPDFDLAQPAQAGEVQAGEPLGKVGDNPDVLAGPRVVYAPLHAEEDAEYPLGVVEENIPAHDVHVADIMVDGLQILRRVGFVLRVHLHGFGKGLFKVPVRVGIVVLLHNAVKVPVVVLVPVGDGNGAFGADIAVGHHPGDILGRDALRADLAGSVHMAYARRMGRGKIQNAPVVHQAEVIGVAKGRIVAPGPVKAGHFAKLGVQLGNIVAGIVAGHAVQHAWPGARAAGQGAPQMNGLEDAVLKKMLRLVVADKNFDAGDCVHAGSLAQGRGMSSRGQLRILKNFRAAPLPGGNLCLIS